MTAARARSGAQRWRCVRRARRGCESERGAKEGEEHTVLSVVELQGLHPVLYTDTAVALVRGVGLKTSDRHIDSHFVVLVQRSPLVQSGVARKGC